LPGMKSDLNAIQRTYGSLVIATRRWNDEFSVTNQLIEGFDQAIGGLANQWTNALTGLMQGTQNIGQAFQSMGNAIIQEIEMIIARLIVMWSLEQLLGLVTGGTSSVVLSGAGAVSSALNANIKPSNVSSSVPAQMNQMSLSTRGGGGMATARAIQDLASRITPASASDVHFAMIKQASIRKNMVM
jgi:hypothetical protein